MKWLSTAIALLIALCAMGAVPRMHAQQSSETHQETQTLSELLQEVRALRIAIERSSVAGARAQLLLGRLQMQEARMVTLGRQVQETRDRLFDVQRDRENTMTEIKRMAGALDQVPQDERRNVEAHIEGMKRAAKQLEQREASLQSDHDGAAQALASEQARWLDFNARLEELERSLTDRKE